MAYVPIPKDVTKIKSKLIFKMTKEQLKIVGVGVVLGFIVYFGVKPILGSTGSLYAMMAVLFPTFFIAMYEKDNMSVPYMLKKRIQFARSNKIRVYKSKNLYKAIKELGDK